MKDLAEAYRRLHVSGNTSIGSVNRMSVHFLFVWGEIKTFEKFLIQLFT